MVRWEYQMLHVTSNAKTFGLQLSDYETQLDKQGAQGWELVNVIQIADKAGVYRTFAVFKKQVEDE